MGVSKNRGGPPGFPLFSPSILGVKSPIFGLTPMYFLLKKGGCPFQNLSLPDPKTLGEKMMNKLNKCVCNFQTG